MVSLLSTYKLNSDLLLGSGINRLICMLKYKDIFFLPYSQLPKKQLG